MEPSTAAAIFVPLGIIWLACAIGSAAIAYGKNRDPIGYFVLGLLLGVIGLLIAIGMPALSKDEVKRDKFMGQNSFPQRQQAFMSIDARAAARLNRDVKRIEEATNFGAYFLNTDVSPPELIKGWFRIQSDGTKFEPYPPVFANKETRKIYKKRRFILSFSKIKNVAIISPEKLPESFPFREKMLGSVISKRTVIHIATFSDEQYYFSLQILQRLKSVSIKEIEKIKTKSAEAKKRQLKSEKSGKGKELQTSSAEAKKRQLKSEKSGKGKDLKECPYCAETIKAKAIKCRYCGSNLTVPVPVRHGAVVTISHDIVISEKLAFQKGEVVEIEAEIPDANRPEYKYIVLSRTLNRRFRLSDKDIDSEIKACDEQSTNTEKSR